MAKAKKAAKKAAKKGAKSGAKKKVGSGKKGSTKASSGGGG